MVFQTEKALSEVGDKIDANDKAAVEADLNALKEAINRAPIDNMTDAQVEDIKAGKEKLMNSAQALFSKVYEAAQGAANAQAQQVHRVQLAQQAVMQALEITMMSSMVTSKRYNPYS